MSSTSVIINLASIGTIKMIQDDLDQGNTKK